MSGAREKGYRTVPTTIYLQKIYLTKNLWISNFTRNYQVKKYENAESENAVGLMHLIVSFLYTSISKYFTPIFFDFGSS